MLHCMLFQQIVVVIYSLIDLAICMSSGDSNKSSDPVIKVTSPVFSPYSSEK